MDLQTIVESEEFNTFMEANEQVINESAELVESFKEDIKQYILENSEIFVDPSLDNIVKNIRVFTEAAVAQYVHEVIADQIENVKDIDVVEEEKDELNEYL